MAMASTALNATLASICSPANSTFGYGLSACTVLAVCSKSPSSLPAPYCDPTSILSDLCGPAASPSSYPPALQSTCTSLYPSACASSSCPPALPSLPSTSAVAGYIPSICNSMKMDGCDACTFAKGSAFASNPGCDAMKAYATLCAAMPGMKECGAFSNLCKANPTFSYCPGAAAAAQAAAGNAGSSSAGSGAAAAGSISADNSEDATMTFPPEMQMYLHTGIVDYVLFKNWVPRTNAQYAGTWIFCFGLSVLYEAWLRMQLWALNDWSRRPRVSNVVRATVRGSGRAVSALFAYILMLIVMSFNVGLIFAVVIGLGVGSALFGAPSTHSSSAQAGRRAGGKSADGLPAMSGDSDGGSSTTAGQSGNADRRKNE
ncbi:hypothetical protein HK101_000348 [Irineochytrium annulatum]|nr:hypothetical protein HK101_000348 [Irineochytrium annulatum]